MKGQLVRADLACPMELRRRGRRRAGLGGRRGRDRDPSCHQPLALMPEGVTLSPALFASRATMAGHCRSFRSFSCSETGVVFVAGFSASAAVAAGARPVDRRPATAAAATWGFYIRALLGSNPVMVCGIGAVCGRHHGYCIGVRYSRNFADGLRRHRSRLDVVTNGNNRLGRHARSCVGSLRRNQLIGPAFPRPRYSKPSRRDKPCQY
jgi:hypothetical protein